jgi:hypothetical protein
MSLTATDTAETALLAAPATDVDGVADVALCMIDESLTDRVVSETVSSSLSMLLPNPASGAWVGSLGAVVAPDSSLAVSDAVRIEPAASLAVVEAVCVAPEVVSAAFAAALSARPEAGSAAADTAWVLPSPAWGFVFRRPGRMRPRPRSQRALRSQLRMSTRWPRRRRPSWQRWR